MKTYNQLSKILHYLNLELSAVREFTFQVEKNLFRRQIQPAKEGEHVFVSGLARSGTTMLMQAIHETNEFASLTYRNMPMILAPNLWSRLTDSFQTGGEAQIRSHGDGVFHEFDSPEALEEVFWKT